MASEEKRVFESGVQLDKSTVEKLDLSKIPLGEKEETAEVSGQFGMWIRSPCNGELWHFSNLHLGVNVLRDATGCVWIENIYI
jgi:hypothetical protein